MDDACEGMPSGRHGNWVRYPWSRRLVHLLPRERFRLVRTDRNRDKITRGEQGTLLAGRIGVIGLSVGEAAALTCAMEGVGGSPFSWTPTTAGSSTWNASTWNRIARSSTVVPARPWTESVGSTTTDWCDSSWPSWMPTASARRRPTHSAESARRCPAGRNSPARHARRCSGGRRSHPLLTRYLGVDRLDLRQAHDSFALCLAQPPPPTPPLHPRRLRSGGRRHDRDHRTSGGGLRQQRHDHRLGAPARRAGARPRTRGGPVAHGLRPRSPRPPPSVGRPSRRSRAHGAGHAGVRPAARGDPAGALQDQGHLARRHHLRGTAPEWKQQARPAEVDILATVRRQPVGASPLG